METDGKYRYPVPIGSTSTTLCIVHTRFNPLNIPFFRLSFRKYGSTEKNKKHIRTVLNSELKTVGTESKLKLYGRNGIMFFCRSKKFRSGGFYFFNFY